MRYISDAYTNLFASCLIRLSRLSLNKKKSVVFGKKKDAIWYPCRAMNTMDSQPIANLLLILQDAYSERRV